MDSRSKASNNLFAVGSFYSNLRFLIDWCQILEKRFPLSIHLSLWTADNLQLCRNLFGPYPQTTFVLVFQFLWCVMPAMHECCNSTAWPTEATGTYQTMDFIFWVPAALVEIGHVGSFWKWYSLPHLRMRNFAKSLWGSSIVAGRLIVNKPCQPCLVLLITFYSVFWFSF